MLLTARENQLPRITISRLLWTKAAHTLARNQYMESKKSHNNPHFGQSSNWPTLQHAPGIPLAHTRQILHYSAAFATNLWHQEISSNELD